MPGSQDEQRLGKYIVRRELGRGGFATVYLAHDTSLRRDVALKLLPRRCWPTAASCRIFARRPGRWPRCATRR